MGQSPGRVTWRQRRRLASGMTGQDGRAGHTYVHTASKETIQSSACVAQAAAGSLAATMAVRQTASNHSLEDGLR